MSAAARLLQITDALTQVGLRFLIMGGHAVRHYGIDRNTFDFDFHVSMEQAQDLSGRLRRTDFGSQPVFKEVATWRPADFRRFQIGVLPNGKEEWLEFWFRNHLLAPFVTLYERREESVEESRSLCYLSLADLIRSKETERDDDWSDVRLLEEMLDARHLAAATGQAGPLQALSQLRSRRGFERAETMGLFQDVAFIAEAIRQAVHPVTRAYLLPFAPDIEIRPPALPSEPSVDAVLRRLQPGSPRHLAVVEAVRLAYQRAAKAADRADKEQQQARNKPGTT